MNKKEKKKFKLTLPGFIAGILITLFYVPFWLSFGLEGLFASTPTYVETSAYVEEIYYGDSENIHIHGIDVLYSDKNENTYKERIDTSDIYEKGQTITIYYDEDYPNIPLLVRPYTPDKTVEVFPLIFILFHETIMTIGVVSAFSDIGDVVKGNNRKTVNNNTYVGTIYSDKITRFEEPTLGQNQYGSFTIRANITGVSRLDNTYNQISFSYVLNGQQGYGIVRVDNISMSKILKVSDKIIYVDIDQTGRYEPQVNSVYFKSRGSGSNG